MSRKQAVIPARPLRRTTRNDEPVTLAEWEEAYLKMAYICTVREKFAPYLEYIEQKIEEARRNSPIEKARKILAAECEKYGCRPVQTAADFCHLMEKRASHAHCTANTTLSERAASVKLPKPARRIRKARVRISSS